MSSPQVDIRALAALARIEVSDAEVEKFEKEIPGILAFVAQIQSVSAELPEASSPPHRNVMREDANPHESGAYTEDLLSAAPARIGNQVAVRQVVSRARQSR